MISIFIMVTSPGGTVYGISQVAAIYHNTIIIHVVVCFENRSGGIPQYSVAKVWLDWEFQTIPAQFFNLNKCLLLINGHRQASDMGKNITTWIITLECIICDGYESGYRQARVGDNWRGSTTFKIETVMLQHFQDRKQVNKASTR